MTTVLVVDDERSLVDLLAMLLTDDGYTVTTAANGQEALAVIARQEPDVIVSDIMMPVLDGYALLWTVRHQGVPSKVILTSAGQFNPAYRPQPDAFVAKPYDIDRIEAVIRQMIRP